MAHTTMDFAQGTAFLMAARCSSPLSVRFFMYFISPAWPASIHSEYALSSGNSPVWREAIPAWSNPAFKAASFIILASCSRVSTCFLLSQSLTPLPGTASSPEKRPEQATEADAFCEHLRMVLSRIKSLYLLLGLSKLKLKTT